MFVVHHAPTNYKEAPGDGVYATIEAARAAAMALIRHSHEDGYPDCGWEVWAAVETTPVYYRGRRVVVWAPHRLVETYTQRDYFLYQYGAKFFAQDAY